MNFDHGDLVKVNEALCRVHAPRWWNVTAHLRWLLARHHGAALVVTTTEGHRLRLTRWVRGARPLTALAYSIARWVRGE